MDAKGHEFFTVGIKKFNSAKTCIADLAAYFQAAEAEHVKFENRLVSLEHQIKVKEADLAKLDEQLKERRIAADNGQSTVREYLNRKQQDLIEREAKIRMREEVIAEQQERANQLLASAENKVRKTLAKV